MAETEKMWKNVSLILEKFVILLCLCRFVFMAFRNFSFDEDRIAFAIASQRESAVRMMLTVRRFARISL